ncbi:MAG TPA: heavy metal translocating P-type ATPase [Acidobacteriaceae bacterium]
MSNSTLTTGPRHPETAPAEAAVETIVLPIQGMTCAACQAHVERSLRAAPGVLDATVNLLAHSARVMYEPARSSPGDLVAVVGDAGYEANLPQQTGSTTESSQGNEAVPTAERRPLIVALCTIAAAVAVMLASMHPIGHGLAIALGAVTLLGMLTAGAPVYQRAWRAARHRSTNMHTLVALGTLAAFGYSAVATLWPALLTRHHIRPDLYYDSVLFILGFLLLGNWLETRARKRALDAVRTLAALEPSQARILKEGRELSVPTATVLPDDIVILRPGERVPVDGIVLAGSSSVDESLLTGESQPALKSVDDTLIGGSLNYDGSLEYRATAVGAESRLGQILRLVEQAQSSRAPMQQLADRVSSIFVPAIIAIAVATFAIWSFFDISRGFAVAVAVLVVACPCAMGLAVPAALTVAIGRGAQLGVLFKGGEALERLAHVDTVLFDKTGTLTEGKPTVIAVLPVSGWTEDRLLQLAASAEQRSEHPLARAVLHAAEARGLTLLPIESFQARPGMGLEAMVDGAEVLAGNARLFEEHAITTPELSPEPGATPLHIAYAGAYAGTLLCRDVLRADAAGALRALNELHLEPIMLTGDTAAAAEPLANALGIREVYAGLSPEQKLERIRELQQRGRRVLMVGDGINDAAAIAQADSGIGMGSGTELAREAGDAILLHSDLAAMVAALKLARATRRVMKQNLGWAAGYNLLAVPIAAGALWAAFGILLSPAVASAAMALSSVSVLLNSLRLRRWSFFPAGLERPAEAHVAFREGKATPR